MKHVIIQIRYSLFSTKMMRSWKIGASTPGEYKSKIFDEERMRLREHIFEKICLPSLNNLYQNKDAETKFFVSILTSINLPENSRERLLKICEEYPFVNIRFCEEKFSLENFQDDIDDYIDNHVNDDECYISARLDDDDALSVSWLKEVERYCNPCFSGFVLSLSGGYSLLIDDKVNFLSFSNYLWLFPSAGLAYVGDKNKHKGNIYNCGSHNKTFHKYPTVVIAEKKYLLRTYSSTNDSNDLYRWNYVDKEFADTFSEYGLEALEVCRYVKSHHGFYLAVDDVNGKLIQVDGFYDGVKYVHYEYDNGEFYIYIYDLDEGIKYLSLINKDRFELSHKKTLVTKKVEGSKNGFCIMSDKLNLSAKLDKSFKVEPHVKAWEVFWAL